MAPREGYGVVPREDPNLSDHVPRRNGRHLDRPCRRSGDTWPVRDLKRPERYKIELVGDVALLYEDIAGLKA